MPDLTLTPASVGQLGGGPASIGVDLNLAGDLRIGGGSPWFDVTHPLFGASLSATPSFNAGAIQEAIVAAEDVGGGEIFFPDLFATNTPLLISEDSAGLTLRGSSRIASGVYNAVSDIFRPGGGTGIGHMKFQNMTLRSDVGGGHCFAPTTGVNLCEFTNLRVIQGNAAKSLWHQDDVGPYIDMLWQNCELQHVAAATVPGFNLKSNSGDMNSNTWQRCRCTYSGEFFFHLESRHASQYSSDNVFRDLTMEITNGGNIKLLGAFNTLIEEVNSYDLTTTTRDLFSIGKHASGLRSRHTTIRNSMRYGGSLGGGLKDIKIDDGYFTRIEKCDTSAGTGFTIDCNNNSYVILSDLQDGVTVQNAVADNAFTVRLGNYHSITLARFTTAGKPAANAVPAGTVIYVSDGGAGAVVQASNGAAWVNLG